MKDPGDEDTGEIGDSSGTSTTADPLVNSVSMESMGDSPRASSSAKAPPRGSQGADAGLVAQLAQKVSERTAAMVAKALAPALAASEARVLREVEASAARILAALEEPPSGAARRFQQGVSAGCKSEESQSKRPTRDSQWQSSSNQRKPTQDSLCWWLEKPPRHTDDGPAGKQPTLDSLSRWQEKPSVNSSTQAKQNGQRVLPKWLEQPMALGNMPSIWHLESCHTDHLLRERMTERLAKNGTRAAPPPRNSSRRYSTNRHGDEATREGAGSGSSAQQCWAASPETGNARQVHPCGGGTASHTSAPGGDELSSLDELSALHNFEQSPHMNHQSPRAHAGSHHKDPVPEARWVSDSALSTLSGELHCSKAESMPCHQPPASEAKGGDHVARLGVNSFSSLPALGRSEEGLEADDCPVRNTEPPPTAQHGVLSSRTSGEDFADVVPRTLPDGPEDGSIELLNLSVFDDGPTAKEVRMGQPLVLTAWGFMPWSLTQQSIDLAEDASKVGGLAATIGAFCPPFSCAALLRSLAASAALGALLFCVLQLVDVVKGDDPDLDSTLMFLRLLDVIVALGGLLGFIVVWRIRHNNVLVQIDTLLETTAWRDTLVRTWASSSKRRMATHFALWLLTAGMRGLAERDMHQTSWPVPGVSPGAAPALRLLAATLSSGTLALVTYWLDHLCCLMAMMVDAFPFRVVQPDLSVEEITKEWNVLQSTLRKAAGSCELPIVFLLATFSSAMATAFLVPMQQTAPGARTLWVMTVAAPPFAAGCMIFTKAAEVTEKCRRVPSLLNSMTFRFKLDEMLCMSHYISHSNAGFFLKEVMINGTMVLKFSHLMFLAMFAVLSRLLSKDA